jgi:hypothetical protein
MVSIKVKSGTPVSGTPLCYSCEWSHVMKGFRDSDEVIRCRRLYPEIIVPFPVRECSAYSDRTMGDRDEMERIAWILLSNRIQRKVGFVKADEFRRLQGSDEEDNS